MMMTVPREMAMFSRMMRARAPAEFVRGDETLQAIVHQHDVCLFERSVRTARAHRHANVGCRQGRRVVHAIADHCHRAVRI
jgi:hypothetical protein